jgi:hypothetical protein
VGLIRRRVPSPVVLAPPPPEPAGEPTVDPIADERCRICERPITVDADHPAGLLVAMLIDGPGERSWAFAHRSCVERTRGRLPF